MNILLLGSGGREHALAWKLKKSSQCKQLYIAPGNAGTGAIGINLDFQPTDFELIVQCCITQNISLIVCGPEDPLVMGLRDYLQANEATQNIPFIGPGKVGAQLEGSKEFSKKFMNRYQIPTAKYMSVTADNLIQGKEYIEQMRMPVVLKADGLAAGKGVLILDNVDAACTALDEMIGGMFGQSSSTVLIEEFLSGIEVSVFVLCDGDNYLILPEAKDYKRIGEGDTGLNTGGMGAVSPVPFVDETFLSKVNSNIILPTVNGLKSEGIEYKGFIFIGLMVVDGEPYVIEYNCRMGDPETEVVIPRIENDLVDLFIATDNGTLNQHIIEKSPLHCTTVMLVSEGYPGNYTKNKPITQRSANELIFHAGTKLNEGEIVTSGGRVIACTARGSNLEEALQASYLLANAVDFEGKYYRKDIGQDLLSWKNN